MLTVYVHAYTVCNVSNAGKEFIFNFLDGEGMLLNPIPEVEIVLESDQNDDSEIAKKANENELEPKDSEIGETTPLTVSTN